MYTVFTYSQMSPARRTARASRTCCLLLALLLACASAPAAADEQGVALDDLRAQVEALKLQVAQLEATGEGTWMFSCGHTCLTLQELVTAVPPNAHSLPNILVYSCYYPTLIPSCKPTPPPDTPAAVTPLMPPRANLQRTLAQRPNQWSDHMSFIAAVSADAPITAATSMPDLPAAGRGIPQHIVLGDAAGRLYIFTPDGHLLYEYSPGDAAAGVTALSACTTSGGGRNRSVIAVGRADGAVELLAVMHERGGDLPGYRPGYLQAVYSIEPLLLSTAADREAERAAAAAAAAARFEAPREGDGQEQVAQQNGGDADGQGQGQGTGGAQQPPPSQPQQHQQQQHGQQAGGASITHIQCIK